MAYRAFAGIPRLFEIQGLIPWVVKLKINIMVTIILVAAGIICFALFYKSIDFFDKI
jgi:hypothetical protein